MRGEHLGYGGVTDSTLKQADEELGVVVCIYNHSTQVNRGRKTEFEASLDYRARPCFNPPSKVVGELMIAKASPLKQLDFQSLIAGEVEWSGP